jgi:hypothetical protein
MSQDLPRPNREVFRDELIIRDGIAALLAEGPKTVPEMAHALDRPAREVLIWVMAMWRYGLVRELPKNRSDAYHTYAPAK